jgi:O-antigen ligase
MKLSAHFTIGSPAALHLFGLASITCILAAFVRGPLVVAAVPAVFVIACVLLVAPRSTIWLFIMSFFVGNFIIEKHFIGVTITDAAFVLLLCAYAGPFLAGRRSTFAPSEKNVLRALVLLLGWSVVTFGANVFSYELPQAIVSVWWLFKCAQLVVFFMVSADVFRDVKREECITLLLLLSTVQIPVALYQTTKLSGYGLLENRVFVTGTLTYHHSMLGTTLIMPLALCIYRFATTLSNLRRILYALWACAFLYIIVLSGTRSVLIGMPFALVTWAIVRLHRRPYTLLALGAAACVAVICVMLSPWGRAVVSVFAMQDPATLDISALSRLFIWEGAVAHFISASLVKKLVGVGIGAYFTVKYDFVLWSGLRHIVGAHNNVLHVLLETGIIGLCVFGYLFFTILRELHRRARFSPYAQICFYLTIALLGSMVSQETFWFQKAFGSFWLFYFVVISLALNQAPGSSAPVPDGAVQVRWPVS